MSTGHAHKHSGSVSQNQKAQLANAYNELGKELASHKVRVVGNYTLGKVIGEGAYGKVRMGTHRLTSTRVAIKQIPKSMSATLTREIHHHRQLHHPHVAQMYEVIATESSIWIVTELCSGGELFDYLVEKGRLSEDETKVMFGQLCLAVAYLHEKGIVHRDLKLENVLLDERCKVKLGDFGFTREFERGTLMETFCGTTGYASPEMLQGKKYQGPEVDVWSLGIILYCLLTGTLPFDDDDEAVMRQKIIKGDFEDPEWLSLESRDLIKNILVMDPAKRLTIPQILTHSWFGTTIPTFQHESPIHLSPNSVPAMLSASGYEFPSETSSPDVPLQSIPESNRSSEASSYSNHSSTFHSTCGTSPPTTPDRSSGDSFEDLPKTTPAIHANPSETTIRRPLQPSDLDSIITKVETVVEEEADDVLEVPSPPLRSLSSSSKAPPVHSVRTPARTKRRSVSSQLSDGESPTAEKTPSLPTPQGQDIDFSSLLSTPCPIIFSTPLERELLNSLSVLGFDLGQIVYSVLNDACDAAGALWWMLKRKAEKKLLEDADNLITPASAIETHIKDAKAKAKHSVSIGTQTEPNIPAPLSVIRTTPQFAIVPPTPTFVPRPITPPRSTASPTSRTLSPSSSMVAESSRSHPTTPAGSMKEHKVRKPRSGSVSIMQRATTALEAAGLVRKKSSEAVKEDKERDKDRERSKETERKSGTSDDPRSSYGSTSSVSKLTKSPPMKATKGPPTTPPPHELHPQIGSPWVLTNSRDSSPRRPGLVAPTPANSPGNISTSSSAPNLTPTGKGNHGSQRNRANLLTAFRLWFHEDRKGKRKENNGNVSPAKGPSGIGRGRPVMSTSQSYSAGSIKRRTSAGGGGGKFARGGRHRAQRGSISSRRSSSVNSRRSSVNSVQMIVLDSPHVPGMRSFGSHTPNSERGEYSSRPSSIRSVSKRHRKSPSASSAGSTHFRTASPIQKYHRRGGSGSSTRVVRQVQTRPAHVRSNSTTSSLHSPCSSRPASFHEFSDNEGFRTGSPFRPHSRRNPDETPRRSGYSSGSTTYFQKRHGLFSNPVIYGNSIGRSSWKKSWGLEPPGWQTRTAHLPVEVLSISPAAEGTSIRDVFSGRQSLNLGDESDWVDEDDDIPYAGGLGQMPTSSSSSSSVPTHRIESPVTLSPAPRGHRNKRAVKGSNVPSGSGAARQKVSERPSPVSVTDSAPEARGGRRQLPTGRAGSAFRQAIQEEDEEEEEE